MKKSNFLFMGLVSVLLCGTSCSNDTDMDNISPTTVQENNQSNGFVCTFDLVKARTLEKSDTISQKGVLVKTYKWDNGQTIRIKFLNGDEYVQKKVKEYASEWLKYANLKFQYVASNQKADIKIGINWKEYNGSWSYFGKNCLNTKNDQPTMILGGLSKSTPYSVFRRTVLHEFGHALGLVHEHQSPKANIVWNEDAVYAFMKNEGWTEDEIKSDYLSKWSSDNTNSSAYDPYSIMHFEIPASFTKNHYSVGIMSVLSEGDKSFVRQQYPGK